jgi:hypothetical protein
MRKEGLDLQLVRFVEGRQTGQDLPDPYLPQAQQPQQQTYQPPQPPAGWPNA